ncbi:MAG TPA: hypothetical protein VK892_22905 [Pyrinomonadaceae bacterium]|nr:hypothetical protein [Pyrinomonadaceae bacterium]
MKNKFYDYSLFPYLKTNTPKCFFDLDNRIAEKYKTLSKKMTSKERQLAENICRRVADIYFYNSLIEELIYNENKDKSARQISALLVGYLSSCKAFLDAVAITITDIYKLPLKLPQQDLLKKKFQEKFAAKNQSRAATYKSFESFYKDVKNWRDVAIHRTSPFVIVEGKSSNIENDKIFLASKLNVNFRELVLKGDENFTWHEPTYLHHKWEKDLLNLCEEICKDVC